MVRAQGKNGGINLETSLACFNCFFFRVLSRHALKSRDLLVAANLKIFYKKKKKKIHECEHVKIFHFAVTRKVGAKLTPNLNRSGKWKKNKWGYLDVKGVFG